MVARLFRFLFSVCFFLFLLGFLAIGAGLTAARAPGPTDTAQLIRIEKGTGLRGTAAELEKNKIIRHHAVFLLAAIVSGDATRLQAGEYEIAPRASSFSILNQMAHGRVYQRKVTVPEGLTTAEILSLLTQAQGLEGDLPQPLPAEGSLLPETYAYTYGETKIQMITRMTAAMNAALQKLWAERGADFPLKSPNDVLTLASIVEKETGVPHERPRVAAVFLNRLRLGMKLQSDPTVIYAVTGGKQTLDRPLYTKDLEENTSPYNTYRVIGLPPGPIANPGLESLRAIFQPAQSDDLYFVADGSGGHAFAKTLAEHNDNVARWRALQKKAP
jgi:UPF0755 protein